MAPRDKRPGAGDPSPASKRPRRTQDESHGWQSMASSRQQYLDKALEAQGASTSDNENENREHTNKQDTEPKSTADQKFAALEAKMRAESADLSNKLSSIEDTLATVKAEHDLLKLKFNALTARSTALEAQNTALEAQNTAFGASMAAQATGMNTLAASNESQDEQLSQIKIRMRKVEALSKVNAFRFISFKEKAKSRDAERATDNAELSKRLDEIATQTSDIEHLLFAAENEKTEAKSKVQALEAESTARAKKTAKLSKVLDQVASQTSDIEHLLFAAEKKEMEPEKRLQALEAENTALKGRVIVLETKDAAVNLKLRDNAGELRNVADDNADVSQQVLPFKGEMGLVKPGLTTAKRDIAAGYSRIEEVDTRIAMLEVELVD